MVMTVLRQPAILRHIASSSYQRPDFYRSSRRPSGSPRTAPANVRGCWVVTGGNICKFLTSSLGICRGFFVFGPATPVAPSWVCYRAVLFQDSPTRGLFRSEAQKMSEQVVRDTKAVVDAVIVGYIDRQPYQDHSAHPCVECRVLSKRVLSLWRQCLWRCLHP